MAEHIPIYPGSSSFFPGDTPFGYFDSDAQFQADAEFVALWCARRLGYPIMDIELQDVNFFTAFEEAVLEYGNQVSTYSARDNILTLMGFDTGSVSNLNDVYVQPSLGGIFKLSSAYGSEAGTGGYLTWYTGSIPIVADKQIYDIVSAATVERGNLSTDEFSIRRIYHQNRTSAFSYLTSGLGSQLTIDEFGANGVPLSDYTMMPLSYDVLKMQAVEISENIRKSEYGFQLTNNRLRIFPIPNEDFTLWFSYTIDSEAVSGSGVEYGKISNHSNIPYGRLRYRNINEMGKQWIRKYTLATAKEMLGLIRGKYQTIPVPGNNTQLNSADLINASEREKDALIQELRDILDQFSRQSQLERKQAESDVLSQQLAKVPLKIYVG